MARISFVRRVSECSAVLAAAAGGSLIAFHFKLESTASTSNPQVGTDCAITYMAVGSYMGTAGRYSWRPATAVLSLSPGGEQRVPVSLNANDAHGSTLNLTTTDLVELRTMDPAGATGLPTFAVTG